jgi:diphthamide synthase (EF-2-diphthine--ammonia ligase)
MEDIAQRALREDISLAVFGDLFLDDIRAYREGLFRSSGIELLFPLWGMPTAALAQRMLASGIEATITCVDRTRLDPRSVATAFDVEFLAQIPPGVDPCGENGEFHTIARNGPGFAAPIPARVGAITEEGPFVYADLVPATTR